MSGVFGSPITKQTLEGLLEYDGMTIGAADRAQVAMNWMNAEAKDAKALQYVMEVRKNTINPCGALCLIYNATGGPVEFVSRYDWSGLNGATHYPIIIQNGQWGAFLHRADNDGVAAVVYRGSNAQNVTCDWMVSWKYHRENPYENRVYTETREENHFQGDIWRVVKGYLENSTVKHKDDYSGCLSYASIGVDTYSTFTAILTLRT